MLASAVRVAVAGTGRRERSRTDAVTGAACVGGRATSKREASPTASASGEGPRLVKAGVVARPAPDSTCRR